MNQNQIYQNMNYTNQHMIIKQNNHNFTNNPNFNANPTNTNNPNNTVSINPSFQANPNITQNPVINNNIDIKQPEIKIKKQKTHLGPTEFGLESVTMTCHNCEESVMTRIVKTTNIKAVLTAIGTLYIGLVCIQICNNKSIGCEDCEHYCPLCGFKLGRYYAM